MPQRPRRPHQSRPVPPNHSQVRALHRRTQPQDATSNPALCRHAWGPKTRTNVSNQLHQVLACSQCGAESHPCPHCGKFTPPVQGSGGRANLDPRNQFKKVAFQEPAARRQPQPNDQGQHPPLSHPPPGQGAPAAPPRLLQLRSRSTAAPRTAQAHLPRAETPRDHPRRPRTPPMPPLQHRMPKRNTLLLPPAPPHSAPPHNDGANPPPPAATASAVSISSRPA